MLLLRPPAQNFSKHETLGQIFWQDLMIGTRNPVLGGDVNRDSQGVVQVAGLSGSAMHPGSSRYIRMPILSRESNRPRKRRTSRVFDGRCSQQFAEVVTTLACFSGIKNTKSPNPMIRRAGIEPVSAPRPFRVNSGKDNGIGIVGRGQNPTNE